MRALAVAAMAMAACGPASTASHGGGPTGPQPQTAEQAQHELAQRNADELGLGGPDAPQSGPSQDEILAAVQKAMTDLDSVAHQCWAAAAVERFDIEGNLELRIAIAPGTAKVTVITDTARNAKLTGCMSAVLAKYPWAPPLRGQTIQLPFKFSAPDGQNVIDRQLVASKAQGKLAVSLLMDVDNTGDEAASMFELAIEHGGTTGYRLADRAELWFFLGPAHVEGGVAAVDVAAGDMMFVPKGGARTVSAPGGDTRAMIAVVPGGREGAARGGALPMREVTAVRSALVGPTVLRAADAKTYGPVAMFAEPSTVKASDLSASVLTLPAGATVAEHVHAKETELLYVLAGAGTLTVAGNAQPVTATSVVQIPAGAKHALAIDASGPFRAVQIYTPAGPEQRFKK
jgi:quercetin dioxygenase-like cupin family protein|nr:cupin domain-containing protein [Kofleriaceae bacterium]